MSLAFLFPYLMLNMFRVLIHPSSGACDLFIELFHGLYCSGLMCVGVTVWYGSGWCGIRVKASASGFKLVSLNSTIKMMHGPKNKREKKLFNIYEYLSFMKLCKKVAPSSL